jgi:UDP-glucose 4-epimerase
MEFPYRRALVTGGAGFIGSHIVEQLLNIGVQVVSVDNYVAGKRENLDACRSNPGLTEANIDILDAEGLKRYFEDVDIVFHNAASKKIVCLRDPRLDLDTNAKGTFNLLELARDFGVKKFVHASTGSVYGQSLYFPQDEKHPLNPSSYYGVSKLAGEKYVTAFAQLFGLDTTVLRYFHVYGPRQESGDFGGVVAIFARKALLGEPLAIFGDGTQVRSFTYVDDVVKANLLAASHPDCRAQTYNCASGIKVTIQDLAERIRHLSGRKDLQIEYGDWTSGEVKYFEPDNSKLKSLGLQFSDFDAGLETTFNWFKDRHEKQVADDV